MDNPWAWQLRDHNLMEAVPCHAAALTASIQPFVQKPSHLIPIALGPEISGTLRPVSGRHASAGLSAHA